MCCFFSKAQTTIYSENFDSYPDGTGTGTNWATAYGNCEATDADYEFNVVSGAFTINDVEGLNCDCPFAGSGDNSNVMTITGIDISNYCDVYVDLDYAAITTDKFECADGGSEPVIYCPGPSGNGRDAMYVEAIIDGDSNPLLFICGDILIEDYRSDPLPAGALMSIRITGGTGSNNETYTIDNIVIVGYQIPDPFAISTDKSTSICVGESIKLTAETDGPWLWNDGSETKSITVSPNVSTNYQVTVGPDCALTKANLTVTPFELPDANAGTDQTICNGESATLGASGGSSYIWDDADGQSGPSPTVSPTSTTTYTVTVTSGPGCKNTDQVTVFVNDPPNVDAGNTQIICDGESVTLTASGAYAYLWSNDMTGASITFIPTSTESFSVVGTLNGCDATDEVLVTVNPNPVVIAGADVLICEDGSAELNATGADSYIWDNGDTGASTIVRPSSNQTYSVTGTLNGCKATDEIVVNVQPKITVDAGIDQTICIGNNAILTASGGLSYIWSDTSIGANIEVSPTSNQTYSVTATDGACTAIDEVEVIVTQPFLLHSTPDTSICAGSTIQLALDAPSGISFQWTSGETTKEIEVNPSSKTTYSVTATDGICDIVKSITVDIDDITFSLSASVDNICFGDYISINAISNGLIVWPDDLGLTTRTFAPTVDTLFIAEAVSNRGCRVQDQFFLSVNELPNLNISGQLYYCDGGSTVISVSDGLVLYEWTDGNTDKTREIRNSGTYTVEGIDANGCSNQASIVILQNELPQPIINGSKTFCPGSSTELSINDLYLSQQWIFDGVISSAPTVSVNKNGKVSLEVTDQFGCVGANDVLIEANPDLSPVISGNQKLCENTTGIIDVGGGFDKYEWSTGANTAAIDISTAASYSVTVSTNDGCSGSASIDIDIVPNPILNIIGDTSYCIGSSSFINVDEFSEILWSDGSSNDSLQVFFPGTVSVRVKDTNGCTATSEIDIVELPLPDVSIKGDFEFCEGDSTKLEIESSTLDNIISILWQNGSSNNTFYAKETSSPSVIITDQFGCENSNYIQVIKNLNPLPRIIAPAIICEGIETKIFTDNSYQNYLWNNEIKTDTLLISNSGSYRVIVTDDKGCQGSDNIIIGGSEPPFIEFKSGLTFCNTVIDERKEPLSINLDTAFVQKNVNGNWSSTATIIDLTNLPIINFDGVKPGSYKFSYSSTNAIPPCDNINRSIILEVLNCNCPNVQFQALSPLCSLSDKLNLSTIQSSNFEGSWQIVDGPPAVLPTINGDVFNATDQMPGDYRLEFRLNDGIAPLGCAETKSINVPVMPHIDASIELVNPACGGEQATFKINLVGGETYDVDIMQDDVHEISLFNIVDGYTFDLPLNGPTTLSFTDVRSNLQSCGFQASSDMYNFQPSQLDARVDLVQNYGDYGVSCVESADGAVAVTIQSGIAPYLYSWSSGSTTAIADGLESGSYSVTVQDAVGCEFISTINLDAPPARQIEIEPKDPECGEGPGRLFLNTISGIGEGEWEIYIDGILQSETQVPAMINEIASGSHRLEVVNQYGCIESHSFTINDDSAFAIDIDDINISLGQSAILQADIGFEYESIQWSPNIYLSDTSSPFVLVQQPLNSTLYTITIRDINNCVFQEIVSVKVFKDRSLSLPTGFTPNGDSNNDNFIIHAKAEVISINTISVFNRWGVEVFNAENIAPNVPINWDWTFQNNPIPEGQYVWQANAKFIDNEDIDFSGKFYIIR